MKPVEHFFNGYLITTDQNKVQADFVHQWLSEKSYWAKGMSEEVIQKSIKNSFCISIFQSEKMIGFARLITDYASFAYLDDVFVEEAHQQQGVGKKLIQFILELDWMKKLRRILLVTLDAHDLYARYGFITPAFPERFMEISRPGLHTTNDPPE